jgi:hypothetical protein
MRKHWLAAALLAAAPALAHDLSVSSIVVRADAAQTLVSVRVHRPNLTPENPQSQIQSRLKLTFDGAPPRWQNVELVEDPLSDTFLWQAIHPAQVEKVTLNAPLFPELPPERTIINLLRNGAQAGNAVLGPDSQPATLGEGSAGVLTRFLTLGVEHILLGPDHLAFLFALLLPAGSIRKLITIVTGFTIAHSVTLAMAATGFYSPIPWLIESVIALSIIAAAGENLLHKEPGQGDYRVAYAFGFGLIHGFGFAGALAEVGMPEGALVWALAGFNLGVEAGQLAIVALAIPLLTKLLKSNPEAHRKLVVAASVAIMAAGAYWLVQRVTQIQ